MGDGTPLVLFDGPTGMAVMTREQLEARVADEFAGLDLVTELLEERRRESEREDASRSDLIR